MSKDKKGNGVTLLEFLIVLSIIIILSTFAVPAWNRFMEINRFNNDIMTVESAINRAKIIAMERSKNIGVCVKTENKTIEIYDKGYSRSDTNPCTGALLFSVTLKGKNSLIEKSRDIIFDPRGLSIQVGASICLRNSQLNNYYKIIIWRGTLRVEKGEGSCPSDPE